MLATRSELLEKIRLGEDSFLELKEVKFAGGKVRGPTQDGLADELAALANSAGGVLLLGVEDTSREVLGIPLEQLDAVESVVRESCEQSIKPPLAPVIERMTLPDVAGVEQPVIRMTGSPPFPESRLTTESSSRRMPSVMKVRWKNNAGFWYSPVAVPAWTRDRSAANSACWNVPLSTSSCGTAISRQGFNAMVVPDQMSSCACEPSTPASPAASSIPLQAVTSSLYARASSAQPLRSHSV